MPCLHRFAANLCDTAIFSLISHQNLTPYPLFNMNRFRLGIIKEEKVPADSRVPFSPRQCKALLVQFPELEIYVAPSSVRCFSDDEYRAQHITLSDDLSHCDVLMGVKEVPIAQLMPHKCYFFFSHTLKGQAQNQPLLRAIVDKGIEMKDYECLVDDNEKRVLGFGRFAGIVGAHNGLLMYGHKTNTFSLPPAHQCKDYDAIKTIYRTLSLPPMRIVLTGTGRVSQGAKEVLDVLGIPQLSPAEYLLNEPTDQPVYTLLQSADLYRRSFNGNDNYYDRLDFHHHPDQYRCIFEPYTHITDLMLNGVFWHPQAPPFFSKADMRSPDFRIRAIADISCDISGSIPATNRATVIGNAVMGYNPYTEQEEAPYQAHTIDIMSIDNLPNELPRDASEMFGDALTQYVVPEFFKPQSAILDRATICKNSKLTPRFEYLHNYLYTSPLNP